MITGTQQHVDRMHRMHVFACAERNRERGQALLILVVLLSLGAAVLIYGSSTDIARANHADKRSRAVLEQARQALIGRAVADANRPGSLPCPDLDDDGSADLFAGTHCASYLGRLPWRTLGVGDLRDESGERLWYALSPNFRDHPAAPPLNSDSKGALVVHDNNAAVTITTNAIAVIFAPGGALAGQVRSDVAGFCASTGAIAARSRCAANYLDSVGVVSNASAAGPYIVGTPAQAFNDKVATIVASDLMPLIERRVALELRKALLAYRASSSCKCYPWPDSAMDGGSDSGVNRGRIPHLSALPDPWPAGALPAYFGANNWNRLIYYAVAKMALQDAGKGCTTCTDSNLTIDGAAGYELVLITPGYAGAGRPSISWNDYVDNAENRDANDAFVTPASTSADRDQLYTVLGPGSACAQHARALVQNVPCGLPGGTLRPECQSASAGLTPCTCAPAAATVLKAPCAHVLESAACQLALGSLQACSS